MDISEMREKKNTNRSWYFLLAIGFGAGSILALIINTLLVTIQNWEIGLSYSPYCGAVGALTGGALISRKSGGISSRTKALGAISGLMIGLLTYYAFRPEWMEAGHQAVLGALSGFIGAASKKRKTRLKAEPEIFRNRNRNRK